MRRITQCFALSVMEKEIRMSERDNTLVAIGKADLYDIKNERKHLRREIE